MNDLAFVLRVTELLRANRVRAWLFGGWGEELRGLIPPQSHRNLDLLYPGRDWARLDALELAWIDTRRTPWRRAFRLDGTTVELLRVDRDARGWFSEVGRVRHRWPADVFAANGSVPVASRAAMLGYRTAQASIAA